MGLYYQDILDRNGRVCTLWPGNLMYTRNRRHRSEKRTEIAHRSEHQYKRNGHKPNKKISNMIHSARRIAHHLISRFKARTQNASRTKTTGMAAIVTANSAEPEFRTTISS